MTIPDLEKEVLALPDRDRASLAAKLLRTLVPLELDISDEEIDQREREIDAGEVTDISHEEFLRAISDSRNR